MLFFAEMQYIRLAAYFLFVKHSPLNTFLRLTPVIALVALARPVLAHEKWFLDPATVGPIPMLFRKIDVLNGSVAAAAVVFVILVFILDRVRKHRPVDPRLVKLSPWVPTIIGSVTGLALVLFGLDRALLAPELIVPDGLLGSAAIMAEIAIGILLIIGFLTRPAAVVLLILSLFSFFWFRAGAIDYIHYIGIAFFLLAWGRGCLSLGSVFGRVFMSVDSGHLRPVALTVLRFILGATFILLGIGKMVRPDLHFALMDLYPDMNPYVLLTIFIPAFSQEWYVFLLSVGEMVGGFIILSGAFIRYVAAFHVLLFVISPLFLGFHDLIGHLPIMAVLLGLVVLGKKVAGEESVN